jgi:D-sedoheptulose 7-phosphate isomerase
MEDNKSYIDNYLKETEEIVRDIDRNEINNFINILFEAWKNGKSVFTVGNGGSASTASHISADLAKTVANDSSQKDIRETKGFKAMCLNDNPSLLTAWVNDSGWENAYSGMLNTFIEEGDVLLLVSVHGGSGWSGNLVKAMEIAKERNAKIISLAGFDGGKMKEVSDSCVVVPKNSTPHTEGFHGVIQHLFVERLRQLVNGDLEEEK